MDWHKYFYYDETSPSCLRWRIDRYTGRPASRKLVSKNDVAGTKNLHGYWQVGLNGDTYLIHRIICEMLMETSVKGKFIDHLDRDRSNNLSSNLRIGTAKDNRQNATKQMNNTSGVTGVSWWTNEHGTRYACGRVQVLGKVSRKSFSVEKYGEEEAFRLACEWRKEMLSNLNANGERFTEMHGI